jgi:hypothetical protein
LTIRGPGVAVLLSAHCQVMAHLFLELSLELIALNAMTKSPQ